MILKVGYVFLRASIAAAFFLVFPSTAFSLIVDFRYEGRLQRSDIDALAAELFESGPTPEALHAVDIYWLRFSTKDVDDSNAVIISQVFIPVPERRTSFPLYVFGPGSTGLVDSCRPSREHIAGIHWGLYRTHVLSHAGQGVIGVLPDYIGFEDPGRSQPYFIKTAEGRVMLDAVRAVEELFSRIETLAIKGEDVFLAGYSQGGHAAFAAADLRESYAPEVKVSGIIGYGPTTDLRALFLDFTVSAPLVVYTYSREYGEDRFDPSIILQERWAMTLEHDVTTQCIGGIQSHYPWVPAQVFTREFLRALDGDYVSTVYPEIGHIMAENSSGLSGHGIPVLIAQGSDDPVVTASHQEQFITALCRNGSPVRYLKYAGLRHDTRQVSFFKVQEWIRARVSGEAPQSDCSSYDGTGE